MQDQTSVSGRIVRITTSSGAGSSAAPVADPCSHDMKRSEGPLRIVLSAKCGNRSTKPSYSCQTYNRAGKQTCTSHKIEARDLYNLVLSDIQSLISQVMTDPDAFYDKLLHKLDGRQRSNIGELQDADGDNIDAKAFIEELKKHGPVQELDEVLLHRLIDKIIIGERQVVNGGKCILQLRGVRPFLSDKYDITQHPNYRYTADFDKRNTFDIEKFLDRRAKLKPADKYDVVEVK